MKGKGGYQIVDLKNANFPIKLSPIRLKGIYNTISTTSKPILVTNFMFQDVKYQDFFVTVYKRGNDYLLKCNQDGIEYIAISSNDDVNVG